MYKENRVHTNIILTDLPKSQIINQFSYFLISYFELAIQSFLSLIIFCYWLNTWPPPISPDSLVVILLADLVPARVRSGQVFLYCCLLMWFYSKLTMLNKNTEIIDLQFYLYCRHSKSFHILLPGYNNHITTDLQRVPKTFNPSSEPEFDSELSQFQH